MELAFNTLAATTSATPGEAFPISRDGSNVAVPIKGGLVVVYCPKTNTDDVKIGYGADSDYQYELEKGQYYALPGTHLPQFSTDLSKWFIKSTGVSMAVQVIYVKLY